MKEEYINPFLTPAKLVWQKELGHALELERAELVSHQFTTEEVTAIIGISGKLEGTVLYGFPENTANSIVRILIGEDDATPHDEMGLSALGEIANMITGNAATLLAGMGYPCDISPPVIVEPAGSRFTTLAEQQIMVTFASDLGPLTVRITLSEGRERD